MNKKLLMPAGVITLAAAAAMAVWLAGSHESAPASPYTPARASAAPDNPAQPPGGPPPFLLRATPAEWQGEVTRPPLTSALCQWAEAAPDEAVPLLQSVPDDTRETVQREVAAALISTHPLEAVKLLDALPPGDVTDQMLRQAGMELAVRDLPAALRWAREQPEPDVRALLLSAALCVQSEKEPGVAAAAVAEIPEGVLRRRLVAEIAQRWEASDPPAAAAFLARQEPGDPAEQP